MHAVRTPTIVLLVVLLLAACIAQLILGATAQTSGKGHERHKGDTTGIVTGDQDGSEFAAANEIVTLIARHQVTGPHGEVALRVAPMVGDGGLQNIRDVLTLAQADMSIVPEALLEVEIAFYGT